ncbi:MAG: hypothetical protein WBN83_07270 [Desulfoprunum sp.]|uniref:hypothetical protein n=1 Tax=Desulfoprunum sp. TaxID=2020866 RepID=UPI003C78B8D8
MLSYTGRTTRLYGEYLFFLFVSNRTERWSTTTTSNRNFADRQGLFGNSGYGYLSP